MARKSSWLILIPQANATFSIGIKPKDLSVSLYEALLEQVSPRDIVKKTPFLAFDIMPTSYNLAGANIELINTKDREFKLKDVIDRVKDDYDFVLIDCPPSLGILTLNALIAADEVLIPVQCEYLAMEGLGQLLSNIKLINENMEKNIKDTGSGSDDVQSQKQGKYEHCQGFEEKFPGLRF